MTEPLKLMVQCISLNNTPCGSTCMDCAMYVYKLCKVLLSFEEGCCCHKNIIALEENTKKVLFSK